MLSNPILITDPDDFVNASHVISLVLRNHFSTGTHFAFILFIICRFYAALETHAAIQIVETSH